MNASTKEYAPKEKSLMTSSRIKIAMKKPRMNPS